MKFVIQEHNARTRHFDFRLERDGVFKSWAIPKGMPESPDVRHLAVQVNDHDIAFGEFEGMIPVGEYGAGEIRIWDKGTYETVEWTRNRIIVVLHGLRLKGRYALVRFKRKGEREWLIQKLCDNDATP